MTTKSHKNIILNSLNIYEKEGKKLYGRKYKLWVCAVDFNIGFDNGRTDCTFIGYTADRRLRELYAEGKLQKRWSDRKSESGRKYMGYALI